MNSTSERQDAQHLRMTTAPVPGLILSLSVPSIITCIITSVYNMADTFFVAQLGTDRRSGGGRCLFHILGALCTGLLDGHGRQQPCQPVSGRAGKGKGALRRQYGLFSCFGAGRRDRCGRAAGAAAADAPAGQYRYHPARSRGLRRSHPAGCAFPMLQPGRWRSACAPREKARRAWPGSLQAGF